MRALICLCAAMLMLVGAGCNRTDDATPESPGQPAETSPTTPPPEQTPPPEPGAEDTAPPADQTMPDEQTPPPTPPPGP